MQKSIKPAAVLVFALMMLGTDIRCAGTGFSVDIIYPENQIEKGSGYFYIDGADGTEQKIEAKIMNVSEKNIIVTAETASCYSSPTGDFIYIKENRDTGFGFTDINYRFENNIIPSADRMELKPGEIKIIGFSISPPAALKGEVIGAVRFSGLAAGKGKDGTDQKGVSINIRNSVTIPVRVRLTQSPEPDTEPVTIGDVSFDPDRELLLLKVANDLPYINRNAVFSYEVYDRAGQKIFANETDLIKMAPKTFVMLPVAWDYSAVPQGDYRLKIGYYNGDAGLTYETRDFTVIKGQEGKSPGNKEAPRAGVSPDGVFIRTEYLLFAGAAFASLIALLFILYFRRGKKHK
jgi:hypothetical protein